jgi:hypothetical protein
MLGQRAVCRPRYDLLARFASFLGHLGIKPLSQMAATIRNNLKELPVSLGQLGHPDWDKRVIVRFIIAAAYSPAPADPMRKLTWPMFWPCNRPIGSACEIRAMPTAGARSVQRRAVHHRKMRGAGYITSSFYASFSALRLGLETLGPTWTSAQRQRHQPTVGQPTGPSPPAFSEPW